MFIRYLASYMYEGVTQNKNNPKNSTGWSRCPKKMFCSIYNLLQDFSL